MSQLLGLDLIVDDIFVVAYVRTTYGNDGACAVCGAAGVQMDFLLQSVLNLQNGKGIDLDSALGRSVTLHQYERMRQYAGNIYCDACVISAMQTDFPMHAC